jgi:hypothetical protein
MAGTAGTVSATLGWTPGPAHYTPSKANFDSNNVLTENFRQYIMR